VTTTRDQVIACRRHLAWPGGLRAATRGRTTRTGGRLAFPVGLLV